MPRRLISLLVLAVLAHAVAAPAAPPATQPGDATAPLERRVTIIAKGEPLEDVLDDVAEAADVSLYVNWPALAEAQMRRDQPVDLQVRDQPLEVAMRLLLRAAGETSFDAIGFRVNDGVLKVSTQADLDRDVVTRTYEIRHLLARTPNFGDAPPFWRFVASSLRRTLRRVLIQRLFTHRCHP